jgi:hypothetical protein
MIGSLGPPDKLVLPVALARFREQRPLVEASALDMNNRAQGRGGGAGKIFVKITCQ